MHMQQQMQAFAIPNQAEANAKFGQTVLDSQEELRIQNARTAVPTLSLGPNIEK